jgi:hypothetical protein
MCILESVASRSRQVFTFIPASVDFGSRSSFSLRGGYNISAFCLVFWGAPIAPLKAISPIPKVEGAHPE